MGSCGQLAQEVDFHPKTTQYVHIYLLTDNNNSFIYLLQSMFYSFLIKYDRIASKEDK
jgi:hypothetical protein